MNNRDSTQQLRGIVAILRITVGIIILVTWYENLTKGVYSADGITGLFAYLFDENGGGPAFYRSLIEATILQAPGLFAAFQMIAELLLGLGLLLGALTPIAGIGAAFFFLNLLFAYWGGNEWIWTYVLLTSSALVVGLTRSGRAFGLDHYLAKSRGEPPLSVLW